MIAPAFAELRDEYHRLWVGMVVAPEHQAACRAAARYVLANKAQYQGIEAKTSVPWFVVGMIDMMEAGGGCRKHLHNGDPLNARTVNVPVGRLPAPAEPPFTWEDSALDAIVIEKMNRFTGWCVELLCYVLESYNGWGYREFHHIATPYLWSYSNQYVAGKYVADRQFDPDAVSEQPGAMPIFQALLALDPSIAFATAGAQAPTPPKAAPIAVAPVAPAPAPHEATVGELLHDLENAIGTWLRWPKAWG